MARKVCYSPCEKCSYRKNNGGQPSWNQRRNAQDIGKETKFWCSSCIEFDTAGNVAQGNVSSHVGFGTEQILYRRPRLVRGWYLGKEPLEHRKSSTPFRFSFQIKDRDAAEKENDKIKALKNKTIIYPESMTVGICSLQTRPVKRERKIVTVISNVPSAGLKEKGKTVQTMRALNKEIVPIFDENPKKELPTVTDNKAKAVEIDSKIKDEVRPLSRSQVRQKSAFKGKKIRRVPRMDYLEFGNENYAYTRKIPDCCVECFTFKESDYDIWSRTSASKT